MVKKLGIEAIIFDMDGVLFDTETLFTKAWYQSADKFEIPKEKSKSLVMSSIGLNHNDTVLLFEERLGNEFPFEAFMNDARTIFKESIVREGLPIKKGVHEILEFLDKSNFKIAIASSSSVKSVKEHLEESNLTKYFPIIIGGDMVKHSKPNPDIYLKACQALSVKPENSIAIEDSPNGIKSAFAAGMKPIMVPDMIQPDEDLKKLLFKEMISLSEVKVFLEQI